MVVVGPDSETKYVAPNSSRNGSSVVVGLGAQPRAGEGSGLVARGDSDDQMVGVIRGHMATDHPVLLDTVSREDLLSWIRVE